MEKQKMSKSLNNAIYLADTAEEVEKKVMQMYTDPGHIHVADPGKVEGNVVFEYLDVFDKEQNELSELKDDYKKGGLGDVVIKKRLIGILNQELEPIREKRSNLEKDPKYIMEMLHEGTRVAQALAKETLKEVRDVMHINYFK